MALDRLDTKEFDKSNGLYPTAVSVGDGVYAIAYSGPGKHGWLVTYTIDGAGDIGASAEDSFEFDATNGENPHIIHISGSIYAIVYEKDDDGYVVTVEIDSAGNITEPVKDSMKFFTYLTDISSVVHVSGDIYAIVFSDKTVGHGQLCTVDIDSAGDIEDAVVDSHEFDSSLAYSACIIKISGTTYAIAYVGTGDDGFIRTLTIENDGSIAADSNIDILEFDDVFCGTPWIVHVVGDIFAVAYKGPNSDGFLKTVEINAAGAITDPVEDTREFDGNYCESPHIIQLSESSYAIAYTASQSYGWLTIIDIGADGTIGSETDNLEFYPWCYSPFLFSIAEGLFGVAFTGPNSDGFLVTIGELPEASTVTTDPATVIAALSATLNGTLDDDGGEACDCGFEWGETVAYGNTTPTQSRTTGQTFTQGISGLNPGQTYHFRAFATNAAGTSYGADRTFRTLVATPSVTTDPATEVT
ncbi:hypothetical protein ES703_50093 [subsurface metagenome]